MPLAVELVPTTLWGKSAARLMKRADWDERRQRVFATQKHRCGICRQKSELKCHELWEYDQSRHIQRVLGFIGVCDLCHFAIHFGCAQRVATEEYLNLAKVISHACSVNRCTRKEWAAHVADAFSIWRERSLHQWTIDWNDWIDPWEFKEKPPLAAKK